MFRVCGTLFAPFLCKLLHWCVHVLALTHERNFAESPLYKVSNIKQPNDFQKATKMKKEKENVFNKQTRVLMNSSSTWTRKSKEQRGINILWLVNDLIVNSFKWNIIDSNNMMLCSVKIQHSAVITWRVHDDVIKWKHFPCYWPFVQGIHRSRWIPRTKASDVELRCSLWSAPE